MLKREDILPLGFLKKSTFTGSCEGMRFLLKKDNLEDTAILRVYAWPEPYAMAYTPSEEILSCQKEFSEEGVVEAVAWLNEVLPTLTHSDSGQ
jgi:hypothetical protein